LTAAGVGGMALLPGCSVSPYLTPYRFFSSEEAGLVDAIADQLIPPGDWPGGKDAGVTFYIDYQLCESLSRFSEDYRKGLAAVRETSLLLHGKPFETITPDEQTAFLQKMEAGGFSEQPEEGSHWNDGFDRRFFRLLRDHAMQGFYGSPRHGGNFNHISYRMIGLDYPLIVGQNRYREP